MQRCGWLVFCCVISSERNDEPDCLLMWSIGKSSYEIAIALELLGYRGEATVLTKLIGDLLGTGMLRIGLLNIETNLLNYNKTKKKIPSTTALLTTFVLLSDLGLLLRRKIVHDAKLLSNLLWDLL